MLNTHTHTHIYNKYNINYRGVYNVCSSLNKLLIFRFDLNLWLWLWRGSTCLQSQSFLYVRIDGSYTEYTHLRQWRPAWDLVLCGIFSGLSCNVKEDSGSRRVFVKIKFNRKMHERVTRNYTNLFFFSLPSLFSARFSIKLYCKTFF